MTIEVRFEVTDSEGDIHKGTMFGPHMPEGCAFEIDYQIDKGRFNFDWRKIRIWDDRTDEFIYEIELCDHQWRSEGGYGDFDPSWYECTICHVVKTVYYSDVTYATVKDAMWDSNAGRKVLAEGAKMVREADIILSIDRSPRQVMVKYSW